MLKKIFALLSLAAIMCSTASAADNAAQKKNVLRELGVYSERPMTYGGFINSLAGYLFENPDAVGTAEVIARSTGMLESYEEYNEGATITAEQAYKFAVVTLGYKVTAENTGGYMQMAAQLGLTDGVDASAETILGEDSAVQILYNMLDAEPMLRYYNGAFDSGYVIEDGETLLSVNRDIYEVKGVLTGTEITSIYGPEYIAGNDCIMIDDDSYIAETNEFDGLLGKNVIAYVKETDVSEYEVVYVYEDSKKNETVTVKSEDIEDIGDSISSITYYDSTGREKTLKIATSPRVIYNGVFVEDYTEDDFLGGSVELTDNNKDGRYDVIKIAAYKTMIVESVDVRDMIIKNRYKFADSIQELNLYDSAGDIIYKIYDANGAELALSEIKTDNVLSVAASKDGKIINIYVSGGQAFAGTVERIDNYEDVLNIGGVNYEMSVDFKRYIAETGKVVKLGKTYTFLIDYFGNISYIKEQSDNDYHVLLKVYLDEDTEIYYAVFMDMNGDWYTNQVSSKVKIDGKTYKTVSEAMKAIKDDGPQVVLLKRNSKAEVTEIDRPSNYPGVYTEEFCKKAETKYTYRHGDSFFHTGTDMIYLEDDAMVIIFPTEDIYDKTNWQVMSAAGFFDGDVDYSIECYNPDKFRFTDLVTVSHSSQLTQTRASKSLYIITDFEERFVDGESLPVIKGNVGQFRNLSFIGKEKGMFDNLEIGDVVNLALDSKGKVEYVTKVFSLMDFAPSTGDIYTSSSFHAGTIEEIDLEEGRMFVNCGASIPFRVNAAKAVTVFDASEKICESKTAVALNTGDKVVLRMSWGKIEEIVCIRE